MDMSPTNNFITTLTQTPTIATQLNNNFLRLKQTNDTIIQYLSYPQKVADDLTTLYNSLQTANELLSVVTVIPEVGEAAVPFKDAVAAMIQEIGPPKDAAVNLANDVKPLITQLQNLDGLLAKGATDSQNLATMASSFLSKFTAIVNCINNLPESALKDTSQNYLNQFSSKAEPELSVLNSGMSDINTAIDTLYNELASIESELSPLSAIDNAINDVLSVLNPAINIMSDLKNDLMSIKIPIPLPYPHMVSLYDVFNTLGQFIDLAMKPIQDSVDKLLDALNIHLPSIPNLSDLLNININLPNIPDFNSYTQSIENFINQLNINVNLFKLNCPPDPNQTDFNSQENS
jgi:hypothetical protein